MWSKHRLDWLVLVLVGACTAGSKVRYVDGQCIVDGIPTSLSQVETRQADLTQHILSRQPILTAIAVAAVAIACAGYVQRLLTMLAARRAPAESLGERVRARMERYRAHPVRYALLLGGVLGVLVFAGVSYVSLDAAKRASERSLASLQFCHLALRSAEEQHVLAEQREHLASIQTTEHDIEALVHELPPAEQQKAQEIVQQLGTTLGQQRTMVAQFAQHADATAKAVTDHQVQVDRNLSKIDDEVIDLKSVPASLAKLSNDVHDVDTHATALGGEIEACTSHVDALGKQLDTLAAKPPPACTCNCAAPVVKEPVAVAPALAPAPPPAQAGSAAAAVPASTVDAGTGT